MAITREPRKRDGAPCVFARAGDGVASEELLVAFCGEAGDRARDATFDQMATDFVEYLRGGVLKDRGVKPAPLLSDGFAKIITVEGLQILLTREPDGESGAPCVFARAGDGRHIAETTIFFYDELYEKAVALRDETFAAFDASHVQAMPLYQQLKRDLARAALAAAPAASAAKH